MNRTERGVSFPVAAALGGLAAFGQAPYNVPIVLPVALILAFRLFDPRMSPRAAAFYGWALGTGYLLHAFQWIVSPFMVDAARHGWMAPFALVLLAGGMALWWALAFWSARLLVPGSRWPLLVTLPAAELARGYVFTGFPWAMPAQALVDALPGQALAWIGPYGLNVVIVFFCLMGATALNWRVHGGLRLLTGAVAMVGLSVAMMKPEREPMPMTDKVIRLVQPNIAQRDKWDPEKIPDHFLRQLNYTAGPTDTGRQPDLVLWSETAIPWLLGNAEVALRDIVTARGEGTVAIGVQREGGEGYHNSLVVLGEGGRVEQTYDKHHLVPFGEFMPFAGLMSRVGLHGFATQIGSGFAKGAGPAVLDFGDVGLGLPLICYEAVFPRNARGTAERPQFLLQLTNDAWFGSGAGPKQHLAQARMRAIEQGLPLARAANTGISAMIDPRGRVLHRLPLNAAGFIDARLPAPLPPTLYARMGEVPLVLLLLFGICLCAIAGRRV